MRLDVQWRSTGPSKTGSCISLEAARSLQDYHESGTSLPPVLLTWRGEEPLDRLHIALKVVSSSFMDIEMKCLVMCVLYGVDRCQWSRKQYAVQEPHLNLQHTRVMVVTMDRWTAKMMMC